MKKVNNRVMNKMVERNMITGTKANPMVIPDERWISHHISNSNFFKRRIINLFGDFTPDAVNAIIEQLLVWEEEDSEKLYENKLMKNPVPEEQLLEPIIININSYGGNVDELLALVDVLEGMEAPILTRALGKVCSCGFVLFCLGDERIVGPNCSLMYHTVSGGLCGKVNDVSNYTEYLKCMQKRVRDLCMLKTKLTKKTLDAWDKAGTDRWLSSKDALKYGIATDVAYDYNTKED